jgi:uncharacterized membrane protein
MYVWRGVMGDHDERAKIVPLVIVVSIVIVTIMALAYSIGRSFWG